MAANTHSTKKQSQLCACLADFGWARILTHLWEPFHIKIKKKKNSSKRTEKKLQQSTNKILHQKQECPQSRHYTKCLDKILCTHVCKWKNDIHWNYSSNGGGMKENSGGVHLSNIYLIYCENFCKCHNVPPPSTTIKK
jgi:ferredoxin-like protein FixX